MKKFKEFFVNSFFYCLAIELVEEILEDIIAFQISSLILKGVSTFLTVAVSYSFKLYFKLVVKKITYKEGNDKVKKITEFFQTIWRNKGTIGGIVAGGLTVVSGAGVIDVSQFPTLMIGTFNLTPFLYYGAIAVCVVICAFFPETKAKYEARMAQKKADKEEKSLVKEAKAKLKEQDKLANQTQAEQEKTAELEAKAKEKEEAKAQAQAEQAKVKAEEEKARAERQAKVDAIVERLRKEREAKLAEKETKKS